MPAGASLYLKESAAADVVAVPDHAGVFYDPSLGPAYKTPAGLVVPFTGTPGAKGPPGREGKIGERGPRGPKGRDGTLGTTGPAGVAGPRGKAGPPGKDGATGERGPRGHRGKTGATGATGASGSSEEIALGGSDDYDFTASTTSSLPAGWSWEQQGSSAYLEELGCGCITWDTGAFNYIRDVYRNLPATFNSVLVKLSIYQQTGNGGTGLILRNSVSGKLCHFAPRTIGSANVTFFSAAVAGSVGTDISGTVGVAFYTMDLYMKIVRNSATSWDFLFGPHFNALVPFISAVNVPAATQGFTPDQVGVGCLTIPNTGRSVAIKLIKFT